MIDIRGGQRRLLKTYRERLARVERGEVWGSDHPGPYEAEERAAEVERIKAAITGLEQELGS